MKIAAENVSTQIKLRDNDGCYQRLIMFTFCA